MNTSRLRVVVGDVIGIIMLIVALIVLILGAYWLAAILFGWPIHGGQCT